MHTLEGEGNDARLLRRGPDQVHTVDGRQRLRRIVEQVVLVARNPVEAGVRDVIDGSA